LDPTLSQPPTLCSRAHPAAVRSPRRERSEAVPPTAASITGRTVLAGGRAHIKTIRETGGELLGHRSLEDDGGLDALIGPGVPNAAPTWGFVSIEERAHQHFGRHFANEPAFATERPDHIGQR
jgi:hypothetical protein